MDTSQIWRFPKKYAELFKNISNEDIGKIIKWLFLDEIEDLEWLNKAYYDIIKVDLQNLERSALNGKKGGRPKKETGGYENKKPEVIENKNLKERKRERKRESKDKEKDNNILDKSNIEQSSTKIILQEDFWKKDINEMQEFIKQVIQWLWLIYKPWKQERNRIQNILTGKQFWETCELANMNRFDFVKNIIVLSTKIEFWKGKIYNAETLYKHYASVYNEAVRVKTERKKPRGC